MTIRFASQHVISEVVDDEAIIINSLTGAYYSLDPVGSVVWSRLLAGPQTNDSLEHELVARYDVSDEKARTDIEALVAQMLDEGLIEMSDEPVAQGDPSARSARSAYSAPSLSKYTDMEELLLLDPIHDVDPQGWPLAPDDA